MPKLGRGGKNDARVGCSATLEVSIAPGFVMKLSETAERPARPERRDAGSPMSAVGGPVGAGGIRRPAKPFGMRAGGTCKSPGTPVGFVRPAVTAAKAAEGVAVTGLPVAESATFAVSGAVSVGGPAIAERPIAGAADARSVPIPLRLPVEIAERPAAGRPPETFARRPLATKEGMVRPALSKPKFTPP
mmetsp:Transcript_80420/g.142327  ORF Transcript_80420/g.142327 Transcript_80420/m.142327 type:complete len:189 (+) Transcript_80420:1474-2040(+)